MSRRGQQLWEVRTCVVAMQTVQLWPQEGLTPHAYSHRVQRSPAQSSCPRDGPPQASLRPRAASQGQGRVVRMSRALWLWQSKPFQHCQCELPPVPPASWRAALIDRGGSGQGCASLRSGDLHWPGPTRPTRKSKHQQPLPPPTRSRFSVSNLLQKQALRRRCRCTQAGAAHQTQFVMPRAPPRGHGPPHAAPCT